MANDPQKVVTGPCVISYPTLFRPRAIKPGDEPRYSCVLIFDTATQRASLEEIRVAAYAAGREKWKDFDEGVKQGRFRVPWRRGEERADQAGYGPGKIFLTCATTEQPGVVDQTVKPVLNPSEVYAGCIVRASIRAFAYDQKGNRGVSFGLNHIQKVGDGTPIGRRSPPENDFGPLGSEGSTGSSADDMFR